MWNGEILTEVQRLENGEGYSIPKTRVPLFKNR